MNEEKSFMIDAEETPREPFNVAESHITDTTPDPQLMLAWLESPDYQQRMSATRAFCELQFPLAVPYLIRLLQDNCPLIRVSAAYALGRNPSPTAIEPLIHQLESDLNGYVRKGIVWALGNCCDSRCLPPLLDALKTDIAAVRLWAASSIGQVASIGYDAIIHVMPTVILGLRRDSVPVVRSNCAWSVGQLCRELPSNVVYATAVDALIEALVEDEDVGVQEDARASLLRLGDPRALQIIEELEQEGFF